MIGGVGGTVGAVGMLGVGGIDGTLVCRCRFMLRLLAAFMLSISPGTLRAADGHGFFVLLRMSSVA